MAQSSKTGPEITSVSLIGSNGWAASLVDNGSSGGKPALDRIQSSVSVPPTEEKETKAVMTRRSSIIRNARERRNPVKKTVSFSSNPNDRKIISVADCIAYMIAGSRMVKIRSNSRQYWRTFTLDPDKSAIRWTPTSKKPDQAKMLVSSMKKILMGKKTEVFRGRDATECLDECCFSIVYGDQCETLDLMAKDADEANVWITGLMSLMGSSDAIDSMFHGHVDERNEWLRSCFRRKIAALTNSMERYLTEEQAVEVISELCPSVPSHKIRQRMKESYWKSNASESLGGSTWADEDSFLDLYKEITTRPEIYHLLIRHANKEYMTVEDLALFLESEQGIVDVSPEYVTSIIQEFEPGELARKNHHLHIEGLTRFLLSDSCDIFEAEQKKVCQDMNQPLPHYFIASSHNTYLVEDQLKGPSSVEGYVQALLNGARFIEMDVWDGDNKDNNEPVIFHGHTLTSKLPLRRALEAVKDYAFARSSYPLILSVEMHCSLQQQTIVVELLRQYLDPMLLQVPLINEDQSATCLPSPEALRNRILIMGLKLPLPRGKVAEDSGEITEEDESAESLKFRHHERSASIKKIRLSKQFSDLVIYCQYHRFESFQKSRIHSNCCLVKNIPETVASKLVHSSADDLIRHSQQYLTRVYPSGMRIDSSNFSPQEMWCCGCQMAALNYQSVGVMMDLNNARFAQNGGCGYVLKPFVLRDTSLILNANRHRKPKTLSVKVISAVNLPKPNGAATKGDVIDPFVKLELFGTATDCADFRTRTIANSGDPIYDETFEFPLTFLEIAILRFLVLDDECIGDDFIGQYSISVPCVQAGYRHIRLKSLCGRDIPNCFLLIHVAITDKRGGGKSTRNGVSGSSLTHSRQRHLQDLKLVGDKALDDLIKAVLLTVKDVQVMQEDLDKTVLALKGELGQSTSTSMKTCMHEMASRLHLTDSSQNYTVQSHGVFPEIKMNTPDIPEESSVRVIDLFNQMVSCCRCVMEDVGHSLEVLVSARKALLERFHELGNYASSPSYRKKGKVSKQLSQDICLVEVQIDSNRQCLLLCQEFMKSICDVLNSAPGALHFV